MKTLVWALLSTLLSSPWAPGLHAAGAHSVVPEAPLADPVTPLDACSGEAGSPCPLQTWMRSNLSGPLQSQEWVRLEKAFKKLGGFAPSGYAGWEDMAKEGAKAAHDQDQDAARKSCQKCHDAFRARYKAEMRDKALP